MLSAVADTAIRHPRWMLGAALAAFAVAIVVGVLGLSGLNARNPFGLGRWNWWQPAWPARVHPRAAPSADISVRSHHS